jgi:hypothetical protein
MVHQCTPILTLFGKMEPPRPETDVNGILGHINKVLFFVILSFNPHFCICPQNLMLISHPLKNNASKRIKKINNFF